MQLLDPLDDRIKIKGLAWWNENRPDLWRLPGNSLGNMPKGVRTQAAFPSDARVCLKTNTGNLSLKVCGVSDETRVGLDIRIDGVFWRTCALPVSGEAEVVCFEGLDRQNRCVEISLPYRRSLHIAGFSVDEDTEFEDAGGSKPTILLYGSSVAQGVGASRSGMSYLAILSRALDMDYINLGFGGAGKGEPEVVELVSSVEASVIMLDLGKSYGMQDGDAYCKMLETFRARHPRTPLVCLTPIFSTRERWDSKYRVLSDHTRIVMRDAVASRVANGDTNLHLLEGLDLLGPPHGDGLSVDGVHPNELGFAKIAEGVTKEVSFFQERVKDRK